MSGARVKLVSHIFGIGRSTVHSILREFVEAVNHNLSYMVDWPNLQTLKETAKEFEALQGLPNCVGALDGTHISIQGPPHKSRQEDYKNRKGHYSIIMQAVVDANCCFTYLHVGLPGRNHDYSHFRQTGFYNMAVNGQLSGLNCPPNVFNPHVSIHPYIIADKAYPLTTWLITPFKPNPGMRLNTDYVMFNTHHSKTRVVVERAFAILKERSRS